MRRIDRDCSDNEKVVEMCISQAEVIRIALNDESFPYVLPLCFGYEKKDGERFFYIHKNRNGKFYELCEKDSSCSFELEGVNELFLDEEKGTCNMNFCSVLGTGRLELVTSDAERLKALNLIMAHYDRADFDWDRRAMTAILVYRLSVSSLTCKATKGWRDNYCADR